MSVSFENKDSNQNEMDRIFIIFEEKKDKKVLKFLGIVRVKKMF